MHWDGAPLFLACQFSEQLHEVDDTRECAQAFFADTDQYSCFPLLHFSNKTIFFPSTQKSTHSFPRRCHAVPSGRVCVAVFASIYRESDTSRGQASQMNLHGLSDSWFQTIAPLRQSWIKDTAMCEPGANISLCSFCIRLLGDILRHEILYGGAVVYFLLFTKPLHIACLATLENYHDTSCGVFSLQLHKYTWCLSHPIRGGGRK